MLATEKMRRVSTKAAFFVAGLLLSGEILANGQRDDALERRTPRQRANFASRSRIEQIERERDGSREVRQESNGDRNRDGSFLLMAKFHKSLPHDELGQVDHRAFRILERCLISGNFDTCEAIPAGAAPAGVLNGVLVNPLGGVPIDLAGPAGSATTAPPVPNLDSPELAANQAECYWMALTRDIPFSQYGDNEVTKSAAANLADMPGFAGGKFDVAMNRDGSIDPLTQLFRPSFVGVNKGPMISQLMANNFTLDSIEVEPKIDTFIPGLDYMTDFDTWLSVQNGENVGVVEERDPVRRHVRNGRDLATVVFTDTIYTEAFRGALILLETGGISRDGFNGPYMDSERQKGFVNYGNSHVMRILGKGERAMRSAWYQKWRVHLMQRPEALGGLIHNVLNGAIKADIDDSLLKNNNLLDRVFEANRKQNEANGKSGGTYLLSQASAVGSPVHPAYPAGHATQNGAFATVLKAMVGLRRGFQCYPDPVIADEDGLELLPYIPSEDEMCLGSDGKRVNGLSFEGEINKMASNVAFGRGMLGVHYRFDSTEGMILGETVAVRILHQELIEFPEEFVLEFRLLRGSVIRLFQDGSFSVDGRMCDGEVYTGVEDCRKGNDLSSPSSGDDYLQDAVGSGFSAEL